MKDFLCFQLRKITFLYIHTKYTYVELYIFLFQCKKKEYIFLEYWTRVFGLPLPPFSMLNFAVVDIVCGLFFRDFFIKIRNDK